MVGWKRVLRGVVVLVLALTLYFVVPVGVVDGEILRRAVISALVLVALIALIIWQVLHQIAHPEGRIDGLALTLVIAVLGFGLGFYRLVMTDPDQIVGLHTRVDALYFTLTTLLTVGYGDIHAQGQAAKILVMLQMVFNVVILATAASLLTNRLKSLAVQRAEAKRDAEPSDRPPRRLRRRAARTSSDD